MIRITHIKRSFGNLKAVDDLSLEVRDGEILALLGPNGAGKTTLISMVCGLLEPDSGSIDILSEENITPRIGYCPQENIIYPKLTCLEQLMFMGRMYRMKGPDLRKKAQGLLDFLGLGEKTHTPAAALSGGMQRRLNLAYALLHDPEILILDEPEAGLDPQSRILVREFIRELRQDRTILLCTHNMDEADRLADRVAVMDKGRILVLGTASDLKRDLGEGDILELIMDSRNSSADKNAGNSSAPKEDHPFFRDAALKGLTSVILRSSILIRDGDIQGRFPMIRRAVRDHKLPVSEMRLRQATLEDVFIRLTGKQLR